MMRHVAFLLVFLSLLPSVLGEALMESPEMHDILTARFPQVTEVGREPFTGRHTVRLEHGESFLELKGMRQPGMLTQARIVTVHDDPVVTDVVYAENAQVESATIRLLVRGTVDAIGYCRDYFLGEGCRSGWERTNISFTRGGGYIEFEAQNFSAYGGIEKTEKLYITSSVSSATPRLDTAQDGALNSRTVTTDATGTAYLIINASPVEYTPDPRLIEAGDRINFSAHISTGPRVGNGFATFKFFRNSTEVCRLGNDDNTGPALPAAGGTALVTGSCLATANVTVAATDRFSYTFHAYYSTMGGGPSGDKWTRISWDTVTADTWVLIESLMQLNISVSAPDTGQGRYAWARGVLSWQNGTAVTNENVTVTFINTTGGVVQTRNITTNSSGQYADSYLLANDAPIGSWTVNVTGIYNSSVYVTENGAFSVSDLGPAIHSVIPSPNPAANGSTVTITANVTDNNAVSSVWSELYYPNGTLWQNLTLSGTNPYTNMFTSPTSPTGNYTVQLWANDTSGKTSNETAQLIPALTVSQYLDVAVDGNTAEWMGISVNDEDDNLTVIDKWISTQHSDGPTSRMSNRMAYDIASQTTLLVGGLNFDGCDGQASDYCNQTWEYNYTSRSWRALNAADSPARYSHAMAYDSKNNVTVIFGGANGSVGCDGSSTNVCNGTWAYNRTTNAWISLNPPSHPSARSGSAMVFDSARDVFILYGGRDASANCDGSGRSECDGTWMYNLSSNTWTDRNPTNAPFHRNGHAMAFDSRRNLTIMFGGTASILGCDDSGTNNCNGTYAYNYTSNSWTALVPTNPPFRRSSMAMTYDVRRDLTLMHGGSAGSSCDGSGNIDCNGTWGYNYTNNSWALLPLPTSPILSSHAMAYDTANNVSVMFGDLDSNLTYVLLHATTADEYDLTSVSVSNNDVQLAVRVQTEDAVRTGTGDFYRVFIGNGTAGGTASPSGAWTPFTYSRYIQVNNDQCTVRDAAGDLVSPCGYAVNGTEMELNASLAAIGAAIRQILNITVETSSETDRYDFAPNKDSFISYTVSSGTTLNLSVETNASTYVPLQTVLAFGNFSDLSTPLAAKDVTVTLIMPNGTIAQAANVTTNATGGYSDTYALPPLAAEGTWTVQATGWNDTENTTSKSTTFTVADDPPVIQSLILTPNPAANATTVTITANVTDDVQVDTVWVSLTYPNGTWWQNTTLSGPNPYTGTFTSPTGPWGNYTAHARANDTRDQQAISGNETFIPYASGTSFMEVTVDGSNDEWASGIGVDDPVDAVGENVAYWRPTEWSADWGGNATLAVDNDFGDNTTSLVSSNPSTGVTRLNFSVFPGTTEATARILWRCDARDEIFCELQAFNYSSGAYEHVAYTTTRFSSETISAPVTSAEGFISDDGNISLQVVHPILLGDDMNTYDVHVTTSGVTTDYRDITSPATPTNATYGSGEPTCVSGWCGGTEFANSPSGGIAAYSDVYYIDSKSTAVTGTPSYENYHFSVGDASAVALRLNTILSSTDGDSNISVWNNTAEAWTILESGAYIAVNKTYLLNATDVFDDDGDMHVLLYISGGTFGIEGIDTDSIQVNAITSGADIRAVRIANNDTHLFGLVNGTEETVRVHLSTVEGTSYGADGDPLPFTFTHYVEVESGACVVKNESHSTIAACTATVLNNIVEFAVALNDVSLALTDEVNISVTAGDATRKDTAPDMDSFISYTVASGSTLSITVDTDEPAYPPTQAVGAFGNFTDDGTALVGKDVTVSYIMPNGTTAQATNVTTNASGGYTDTYALPLLAPEGTWTVNVIGWNDTENTTTKSTTFTVTDADPIIHSLSLNPNPAANGSTVAITANVTDDVQIDTVWASLTYPNGTWWQNVTLTGPNPYTGTFTSPTGPWGNYAVQAEANDTRGQTANEETEFIPYARPTPVFANMSIDGLFGEWDGIQEIQDRTPVPESWSQFRHNLNSTGATNNTGPGEHLAKHFANFTAGGNVYSTPAVADGIVYIGSDDGRIYALDASTLNHIANFTTGDMVRSSPAVADGIVYIGSNDDRVYALDASTLNHIANFTTGGNVLSSPAVANGIVYIGGGNRVFALNASTLNHMANFTTSGLVESSPAVADGIVYIGSNDDRVYALNASTLNHIANFTTGGNVLSAPAVADGIVYVGSDDVLGHVYALNASTLDHIANFTTGSNVLSSPAVANGIVYMGGGGRVYALNASTLVHIANFTTSNWVLSSPAVVNGIVYIDIFDGRVYALNASTLAHIANFTTSNNMHSSPAVAGGLVYVGSLDGRLYALGQSLALTSVSTSIANDNESLYVRHTSTRDIVPDRVYRAFIGNGTGTNDTSPSGAPTPFSYSHFVQINGSECKVHDSTGEIGSCNFASNGTQLEIDITRTLIGADQGDTLNVTLEERGATSSFTPQRDSFISYTVTAAGPAPVVPPPGCTVVYVVQGPEWRQGYVSRGDIVQIRCPVSPIGERSDVRVSVQSASDEDSVLVSTPRLLFRQEALYP